MYFSTNIVALLAAAVSSVSAAPAPISVVGPRGNSTELQLQALPPQVSFSTDPGCAGAGSKQIALPGKCVSINDFSGAHNNRRGMKMEYLVDNKDLNCAIDLYTNGACFGSAAATETYPAQKQKQAGGSCVDVSAYASLKANCSNAVLGEAGAVLKTVTGSSSMLG
ncbi:hypothetical protein F5X96DRAFT_682323 [Biscogniauxia mediterranea]|nr:hypothetical protein F5X96DRAFT_682323 [Biscogniauxia mediterranea]